MGNWIKDKWQRFKLWIAGVLAAIGITVTGVAMASVTFTVTMPTEYEPDENGVIAPLPLEEIAEVRLYCDGDPTPVWTTGTPPGPAFEFTVVLGYGRHDCQATVVATNAMESGPSNTATKIVTPTTPPNPPGLQ